MTANKRTFISEISLAFVRSDTMITSVLLYREYGLWYKLKLNHGDLKATQGDTGHAEIDMITRVYAHILDEDRKLNAQKFESAFYGNPDLRSVRAPEDTKPQTPPTQTQDLASLIVQLQQSPELVALLSQLVNARANGLR